ncbi:hypothetical protein [Streptomyces sp. L7]|uniref:hypothetical protein n=1 Tax=Streptomyces sp. L7 TaxID=3423954 RepID=UPI003D9843C5
MANLTFTLRSGRRVGVTTLGDPVAERVIVFCHPAPGSSVFDPDPDASANRGVHIVSLDRAGYGSSAPGRPAPGRASWAPPTTSPSTSAR